MEPLKLFTCVCKLAHFPACRKIWFSSAAQSSAFAKPGNEAAGIIYGGRVNVTVLF